ncbi:collagen alpha-2(I) chain-like [Anser cygnoides]|uniref:collagen alpha-2(I) chain-like n=1 Tax=Anser cygnoides TaxID=8845 RepID=UPI0034D2D621
MQLPQHRPSWKRGLCQAAGHPRQRRQPAAPSARSPSGPLRWERRRAGAVPLPSGCVLTKTGPRGRTWFRSRNATQPGAAARGRGAGRVPPAGLPAGRRRSPSFPEEGEDGIPGQRLGSRRSASPHGRSGPNGREPNAAGPAPLEGRARPGPAPRCAFPRRGRGAGVGRRRHPAAERGPAADTGPAATRSRGASRRAPVAVVSDSSWSFRGACSSWASPPEALCERWSGLAASRCPLIAVQAHALFPLTTFKRRVAAKGGLLRAPCALTALLSGCAVSRLFGAWRQKGGNENTILEEARAISNGSTEQ